MKAGWTERERTKRVGGKQEKVDQKNNRDRDRQAGWEAGKTERKRGKKKRPRQVAVHIKKNYFITLLIILLREIPILHSIAQFYRQKPKIQTCTNRTYGIDLQLLGETE